MYNAAIKALIAGSLAILAACSGSNRENQAGALLEEAQSAYDTGNARLAISLLDSLDKAYPEYVDIRRNGMHVRAMAMEKKYSEQLAQTDSLLTIMSLHVDSLKNNLQWVNNPIEGYYVARGSALAPTGIQARISREGVFYIVSSLTGHPIKHTSIAFSSDAGQVTSSTVAYDGERNTRNGARELIHFVGAECDTLGQFALDNATAVLNVSFLGSGRYSRPLTENEHRDIATVYDYASSLVNLKVAALQHEKLEKQLAIARSQSARTFNDSTATPDKAND